MSSSPSNGNGTDVPGAVQELLTIDESTQAIDLEVPLDESLTTVVRLAVAALANEAGIGPEQAEVARQEMGSVFSELCHSTARRQTAQLHVEVGSGALLVVARTSAQQEPVTVRWWSSVPDPI